VDPHQREKSRRRGDEDEDCCSPVLRRRQYFSPLSLRAACFREREKHREREREREREIQVGKHNTFAGKHRVGDALRVACWFW
jgi:hypothetical protein